jgi:hypothetical protein
MTRMPNAVVGRCVSASAVVLGLVPTVAVRETPNNREMEISNQRGEEVAVGDHILKCVSRGNQVR